MNKTKHLYLKLFLGFVLITFMIVYFTIHKLGRITDIDVKDPSVIIIDEKKDDDDNDNNDEQDDNHSDIYVYTDDGKNQSNKISIDRDATGLGNYYSQGDVGISSDGFVWKEVNTLNIFNNEKFNDQKIIAPGVRGSYEFVIKNLSHTKVSYVIGFGEDYNFFVNMKYRLSKNGKYIIGNDQNWVSIKDLSLQENLVSEKTNNTYVLEWYWDSDERDAIAGMNGGYYTLKLLISTINTK